MRVRTYSPWCYSGLQSPSRRSHQSFERTGCWLRSPVQISCFPSQHGMAIHRFFMAVPYIKYCSAVWFGASPALLKDLEKVQLRVARAIVRNLTLQDVSTLQQARLPALSWRRLEHCLGLLWQLYKWERLSCTGVVCTAIRTTRFPHSFRFSSAPPSRHLSSFLCPTVPIWNRLPSSVISSMSLSSFRSAVQHYFVLDMSHLQFFFSYSFRILSLF